MLGQHRNPVDPAPSLPVSPSGTHRGAGNRETGDRDQKRDGQRALLPGSFPRAAHHARGSDHRGDGAGGRGPRLQVRQPGRGEAGLFHGDRQGQVPEAGPAGRPAAVRGRCPQSAPSLLEDGGGSLCGGQPRLRSRVDGDGHGRDGRAGGRAMSPQVHQTAIVHPKAELADDVSVGPYTVISEHVRIGRGTRIDSHVVIEGWTEVGERCQIHSFVSLGAPPQHLKYNGEETYVRIGSHNILREYVTVNRATAFGGGVTSVGEHNVRLAEAVKKVRDECGTSEDVQVLLKFLDGTKRGICKGSDEREEE